MWKIGIDAELVLVGWDAFVPRLITPNFKPFAEGGFDILFVGWTAGTYDAAGLSQFYHTRNIGVPYGNYFPINNSRLDLLIDKLDTEPDMELRKEYIHQALDILVWEEHPTMGLYQQCAAVAKDAAVWDIGYRSWGDLAFSDSQSEYVRRMGQRFWNLNPAFYAGGGDAAYSTDSPAYSHLYERDRQGIIQPLLAAAEPIPIGSNDAIAELVDPAMISVDSPYKAKTHWGPNPNIDTLHYNATVTAANHSMFLIRLRKDIPWHPGYGYTAAMKLNATVDDLLWTWAYLQDTELPKPANCFVNWQNIWGADWTKTVEKINETLVKVNFRGALGSGIVPTWYSNLLLWYILPRHILDPTFDATPYGGNVGTTPDGTPILPYAEQERYRYNTGAGDRPIPNLGPYYFERWDESTQTATYRKFPDWGGYGSARLYHDPCFQHNNIETIALIVIPDLNAALIALEKGDIDSTEVSISNIAILNSLPDIQLSISTSASLQVLGYNTRHPRLNNRYVRLAISHLAPTDRIVHYTLSGLGVVNEVVGVRVDSCYYPTEEEWQTIGLDFSENVDDPETGDLLEFQGHIRYNPNKAWALMEKAGYDMTPFREAAHREEAGEQPERGLEPLPLLLASASTLALVGAAFILGRRYWQQHITGESEALQLSRQRKRVMQAIKLRQSPRMAEKAQAQELFQQLANDKTLTPELAMYSMLNLCDMLLDEVRAYGDQAVLREAEALSNRIAAVARKQKSGSVLVEALLLQSKFALLEGKITQADNLLIQASAVAEEKGTPKLAKKAAQEQAALASEVKHWEALSTEATPLRERLDQTRLQNYIAAAVRLIEIEERLL
ncbi:MAG: ABC transporter substrate-binding protein [Candidatus Thorarchaeota archaeon]